MNEPEKKELPVAFSDISNFAAHARGMDSADLFGLIDEFAEITGRHVVPAGGRVIKIIGDADLIVFPAELVNEGVRALRDYRIAVDRWLFTRGMKSTLAVKVDFGEVCHGMLGPEGDKRYDVIGATVNNAALLRAQGMSITPQVFRALDRETRTHFKKHTPPVSYIDVDDRHSDRHSD